MDAETVVKREREAINALGKLHADLDMVKAMGAVDYRSTVESLGRQMAFLVPLVEKVLEYLGEHPDGCGRRIQSVGEREARALVERERQAATILKMSGMIVAPTQEAIDRFYANWTRGE